MGHVIRGNVVWGAVGELANPGIFVGTTWRVAPTKGVRYIQKCQAFR